jgi:hypothetical protein
MTCPPNQVTQNSHFCFIGFLKYISKLVYGELLICANLRHNPLRLLQCQDARLRHPFWPCHRCAFPTLGPGGIRTAVAESVLVKQQLLTLNRSRRRVPNLRASDRFLAGLHSLPA